MAGLDPSAGVGGVMPDDNGGQGGGLSNVLQQVMFKNYLQSALLGLATPTWGGAGNAVYNAAASAANTDAATNEAIGKESVREQESAQNAELQREQMASHEKVASITGESRQAAAEIRAKASIDRAHIALQKLPASEQAKWTEIGRKIIENNFANLNLDPLTKSQMIREEAARQYGAASDRAAAGGPAANPEASTEGATTPAGIGAGDSGGGVVPGKTPATGAKGGPLDFSKIMADPGGRALLNTPDGQKQLLARDPTLKSKIDAYNKDTKNKAGRQEGQLLVPGAGIQ
jgi:hypothetical protein